MTPELLAQWLATHHLLAVAGSVGLVWWVLGLGWWVSRRSTSPAEPRPVPVLLLLVFGLILGVILGVWAWLTLARTAISAAQPLPAPGISNWLLRFDLALLQALPAQLSPAALQAWSLITHAGDALVLTALAAVVALLLWRRRAHLLLGVWLLGLATNGLLIRATKATVERLRPNHAHDWSVVISGSSFPSGHAGGATMAWGLGAYLVLCCLPRRWHLPALLGAALLIVCVGWSRVLLQVHHASDVLAGWLGGGLCLLLCIAVAQWSEQSADGSAADRVQTRSSG